MRSQAMDGLEEEFLTAGGVQILLVSAFPLNHNQPTSGHILKED